MIHPIELRDRLLELISSIDLIVEKEVEGEAYLTDYLIFADEIDYPQLGTKAALNELRDHLSTNGGSVELQKVFNTACMMFSDEDMASIASIVERTVMGARDSSIYKIDNPDVDSKLDKSINGDIDNLHARLMEEPWYLMTFIALI